jgi:hypothetical protein
MRKYWPVVIGMVVAMSASAMAQDAQQAGAAKAAATVDAAVGTAIAERALTGAADNFKADAGKLYCFSKIENAADSEIEHVWYKGDAEQARVKLSIKGSPWRTYSAKTLPEDAVGDWRCDVVQDGKVLKSVAFKVE